MYVRRHECSSTQMRKHSWRKPLIIRSNNRKMDQLFHCPKVGWVAVNCQWLCEVRSYLLWSRRTWETDGIPLQEGKRACSEPITLYCCNWQGYWFPHSLNMIDSPPIQGHWERPCSLPWSVPFCEHSRVHLRYFWYCELWQCDAVCRSACGRCQSNEYRCRGMWEGLRDRRVGVNPQPRD